MLKLRSLILVIIFWLTVATANQGQHSVGVEVVFPKEQMIYEKIHSAAVIDSPKATYLFAESAGKITNIYCDDGRKVKAGELLAQIDDQVKKSELDLAVAELNLAQLKLDRAQKLLSANATSQANFDQINAELTEKKSKLFKAQDDLEKSRIIAPFDGVVGFNLKREYEIVNIGDKIFRLEQSNPLEAEFNLPRRFYDSIKLDNNVEFHIDDNLNTTGKIIAISQILSPEDESFSVKATINNEDHKIVSGMFTSIDVIANTHKALLVPQQAIVLTDKGAVLYVLKGGKIHIVPIIKGENFNDMVEIKSGISASDQIVISGQMKLYENMDAHPLPTEVQQ